MAEKHEHANDAITRASADVEHDSAEIKEREQEMKKL